jgi:hypothetical protein
MSVSIQTVEFERRQAHLSELESGPPFTVHGVALGNNDVTVGQSGIKKLWPAEELEKAADTLEGRSLVVDHNNDSDGVVGEVTKAGYKDTVGVIYEAELFDEELADKINNGLLEVSIRGKHVDVEQMDETEEGAKVVEGIAFDNLSIVPTGAAPSNSIDMGEAEELSLAELSAAVSQLAEIQPGMWVKSDGTKGITVSQVQDGEIEVDVYEESDGKWRSTGETEMFETDSLTEWDVDEEDIGTMEDSDESSDEEEAAVTSSDVPTETERNRKQVSGVPDNLVFNSKEDAMSLVEEEEDLTGVHQMEGFWVPGADHDEFLAWRQTADAGANSILAAQGDKVQWDSSGGLAKGVVVDRQTEGCFEERIDGDVKVCAEEDDAVLLINIVQETDDGYEKSGEMVAHKESTVEQTDFSLSKHKMDPDVEDDKESEQVDAPEWTEGQLVQWQVEPQLFGKIVHVDEKRNIVMVEIHERMDGPLESTGFTISAGFSDIMPLDHGASTSGHMDGEEEMEETFSDYPEAAKENAQMALDAREETGNPNDCGTDVGWKRANQLSDGEALSRDVVAKMSAFNRHRSNSEMDDDEGRSDCGWMMWKAWGGDEGVDWATDKMDEIEEMSHPEGSEDAITSDADKKENRERSPERFPDDVDELQAMHKPEWDSAEDKEWNAPDLEDFTDESWEDLDGDMREDISNHFLVSKTGEFPPERFSDLALPVVEPDGTLNLNALSNAKARAGQVEEVSSEDEEQLNEMIDMLANENFEDATFGEDEEEAATHPEKRKRTIDDTGDEPGVKDAGPVDVALDLINKYLTIEGNHERDTVDNMLSWLMGSVDLPIETLEDFRMAARRFLDETPGTDSFHGLTVEQFRDWLLMHGKGSKGRREQETQQRGKLPPGEPTSVNVLTGDDLRHTSGKSEESELDDVTTKVINMTDEIEQKLAELSEPVAVEQSELEELQEKADRFGEMSSTLESLKERTDILDSVDRSQVEELADSDDPMVVESARYESLSDEAEQVKGVYAAALAEEMPAFSSDELADKFSIESLREKYEEQVGELEDELSAEPRSGDVDEEELEERAGEEEELEASETDEAEEAREELREQILG